MSKFKDRQDGRKLQESEIYELLKIHSNKRRFEAKISYEPMSGCWLWSGAVGNAGHGQFFLQGKQRKGLFAAHRASWMVHYGELNPYSLVCHKCDNPYCVNPDHLFVGTHKDNSNDCKRKGRTVMPNTVGESNSGSKLSEVQVLEIRASSLSIGELSEKYGVAKTTICAAQVGFTWPHLPGARAPKSIRARTSKRWKSSAPTGERRKGSGGGNCHVWQKVIKPGEVNDDKN